MTQAVALFIRGRSHTCILSWPHHNWAILFRNDVFLLHSLMALSLSAVRHPVVKWTLPLKRTEWCMWVLEERHDEHSAWASAAVGLQISLCTYAIDFSLCERCRKEMVLKQNLYISCSAIRLSHWDQHGLRVSAVKPLQYFKTWFV